MSELTTLKGIGKGRAEALAGLGVETLADMAALDGPQVWHTIAEALGVSPEQVELWQDEAQERIIGRGPVDVSIVGEALSAEEVAVDYRDPREEVWVRILCERGLLAGRAVFRGERHQVLYRQYMDAVRVNPEGYSLAP